MATLTILRKDGKNLHGESDRPIGSDGRRPRRREDVGGKDSAIGSRRLIRSEERIPRLMDGGSRTWCLLGGAMLALSLGSGCATMRRAARDPDLRPCADGFALTADGWRLGIRHIRPQRPDPGKDPVVL